MRSVRGVVALLLRYPVKSTRGEQLDRVAVEPRGLAGDREWAVRTEDGGIASGKTTRRFRRVDGLLDLHASLPGPVPVLEAPSGARFAVDDPDAADRLTAVLGRPVTLAREGSVPHHDEAPVHVLTGAALRGLGRALGGRSTSPASGRTSWSSSTTTIRTVRARVTCRAASCSSGTSRAAPRTRDAARKEPRHLPGRSVRPAPATS